MAARRDWQLVGRDDDLAALTRALRRSGAVVIVGDAGVGKSRLAREVLERVTPPRAARREPAVLTATRSARDIPLGALAPWLPPSAAVVPDGGTVRRAADALAERGAASIVVVDDAHHLDGVSATVLHHLATRRAVRLVLTLRGGEPVPDAVTALWKDELAVRWELPSLDETTTTALVRAVLEGTVDEEVALRLFVTTGGNALWLRHLLDGERESGRLVNHRGRWHWSGRPRPNAALKHLITERVGVLSSSQREALELLALGEPLGPQQLGDLVDPDTVDELLDRGLVQSEVDGVREQLRLGHPLYGEVVRSALNPVRTRRLRRRLSDLLAATGSRRSGDVLRRAVLDLDSGHLADPALLADAAARSVALGDVDLAERLFRAARDAGGGFEPQLGLGSMLMWRLHAEDAERELVQAADVAETSAQRARALRARVQNAYLGRADVAEAVDLLEAEILDGPQPPHPDLVATRSMIDGLDGRCALAAAAAREVLGSTDASWAARTIAGWVLVAVRALQGHGDAIDVLAAEALQAARNAPECAPLGTATAFWEVVALGLQGELTHADDRVRAMREGRGEYGSVFATMSEARLALDRGQVRTARSLVESIVPAFAGYGSGWASQLGLMATAAAAMTGDASAAAAAIDWTVAATHPGVSLIAVQVELARAWSSAVRDDLDAAVTTACEAAELAHGAEQDAMEMLARHTAVCFGDRGQAEALARLAGLLDGPRPAAACAHARAWTDRDPAALLTVGADFERLGLLLFAADALAQASTLHRDAGCPDAAAAAAEQALSLAARCEGATTPALRRATLAHGLSDREREIAVLAARGLTNRDVAAHLGVSVRTVESHVYNARARLGLTSRADLIALVTPRSG